MQTLVDAIEGSLRRLALEQKNPRRAAARRSHGHGIYDFLRSLGRVPAPALREVRERRESRHVQRWWTNWSALGAQHAAPLPILMTFPAAAPTAPTWKWRHSCARRGSCGPARRHPGRLDPPDAEHRVREAQEVLVVVDRLPASDATRGRLADAVATRSQGEGVAVHWTMATDAASPPIPRAPLRHGSSRAPPDPVLVQQPAGRVPGAMLRRRPGVRRIAHRPYPGRAWPGCARSVDQTALRSRRASARAARAKDPLDAP